MQFLSEHCLNGCQIFGWFGFFKMESEPIFVFPHSPENYCFDIIGGCREGHPPPGCKNYCSVNAFLGPQANLEDDH